MPGEVTMCPVCGSDRTSRFLDRPSVVVHQNVVLADRAEAQRFQRGALAMRCCERCGFVHNAAFNPSLPTYGADYDNRQTCSEVFQSHVNDLADDMLNPLGVRNCRIVEVGCGDGEFLRKLVVDKSMGNVGYGFDPSYAGCKSDLDGRLQFVDSYYDHTCADIKADVVVCRHVIEHVPDPLALLRSVSSALADSAHARVFFETPCVRWILINQVVWDLFYEHCSLFSCESLTCAFELAGFAVDDVRHVFGGQYLWLQGHVADEKVSRPHPGGGDMAELACAFSQAEERLCKRWGSQLRETAKVGPVALWGAAAKGATFASLVDPDCTYVDCLVDVNPAKQGKFLAGTGHLIVGPDALKPRRIRTVLILNPNYQSEIERTIADAGLDLTIVDMMASME